MLDGLSPEQRRALIGGTDFVDRIRKLRDSAELVTAPALHPPSDSKTVADTAHTNDRSQP